MSDNPSELAMQIAVEMEVHAALSTTTLAKAKSIDIILSEAPFPIARPVEVTWREGAPPKPWSEEWFIAITTFGDRVVLRALPDEFTYDFKTADETYMKRERIAKWAQFPDSSFKDFIRIESTPRAIDQEAKS